ncbi:hypothetical protein AB6A23_23205 [Paenibacillus tarimensis]
MKKKLLSVGLLALIVFTVIWEGIRLLPKSYNVTFEGVKYQLGAENADYIEPAVLHINGTLQTSFTGSRTFQGTIDIEGEEIPVPENQREIKVEFGMTGGYGIMTYGYFEDGEPHIFSYGSLFINEDISKIAIGLLGKNMSDAERRGWSSADGYMLTAPARDRTEGLEVANELMNEYLQGMILE